MKGIPHLPVLLEEVLEYLICEPGGIYVDGTVGGGGHARAILERSAPTGRLIGLDWDEAAIERARANLAHFGDRVLLVKANFKDLRPVLNSLSIDAVNGILLDLGVSTELLEDPERGFSFLRDGPLDMRMSQEIWETAQDLVAKLAEAELREIIHEYGEERWAKRIAQAIVRQRRVRPIRSTRELAQVIEKAIASRRGRIHPATRTFQALRIAVNDELANLRAFLGEAEGFLRPGGRLCVISFHSLEDRIVKEYYRRWGRGGEGVSPSFRILTPKGIAPSRPEILQNPRARSARLRAAEKLPV